MKFALSPLKRSPINFLLSSNFNYLQQKKGTPPGDRLIGRPAWLGTCGEQDSSEGVKSFKLMSLLNYANKIKMFVLVGCEDYEPFN